MSPFTKRVIDIIAKIPPGKVMAYGQIAKFAGSPRAARQVVRILHSMSSKYNLPWHRVINAQGEIPIKDQEAKSYQRDMLLEEGVTFIAGKVDLPSCLYEPEAAEKEDVF